MSWTTLSKFISGLKGAYNDINPSTLTGAVDVIIVRQRDGSFSCGPFYVKFGKLTAFSPADKIVEVYINNQFVEFLHMRLSNSGDAYFIDSSEVSQENHFDKMDYIEPMCLAHKGDWAELTPRRRRKKVRRDSAMSEPDVLSSGGIDTALDCENGSNLEVMNNLKSNNCDFVSESQLCDCSKVIHNFDWDLVNQNDICDNEDGSNMKDLKVKNWKIEEISNEKSAKGVYLEDLVGEKFDDNIKETYIYSSTTRNVCDPVYKPNLNNLTDRNCIDYGYRSDNENSPRSMSPLVPHINSLRLSLCGGLFYQDTVSEDNFLKHMVSYEEFVYDPHAILANPNLVVYLNGRYMHWKVAAPSLISLIAFQTELPYLTQRHLENLYVPKKQSRRISWFSWGTSQPQQPIDLKPVIEVHSKHDLEVENSDKLSESSQISSINEKFKYNRLNSADVSKLNLKPGRNDIEFRVTTKYQGTCSCSSSIYLWNWSDRIIVSDVDGTITKSDVLGHLLPMLGHDWTHSGVAGLYNKIAHNGYRFVYLSARAIGQAGITRSYLRQVVQNSNLKLPDGPILVSPSSLLHAFHQEVIINKPENFKIQCLADVCSLFPNEKCPLFAGFGNKENDVFAYETAGIAFHRIFTIKPSGQVRNEFNKIRTTTYTELERMVDHMFPCLHGSNENDPSSVESDVSNDSIHIDYSAFSQFNYWQNLDYDISFGLPDLTIANDQ